MDQSVFLALLPDTTQRALASWEAFDELMAEGAAEIHREWPDLGLPTARFYEYLAARVPAGSDAREYLEKLRFADFYLACAFVQERPGAFEAIDEQCRPDLQRCVERLGLVDAEDVRQSVYERLFFAPDRQRARISQYRGIGALRRWVRISALRLALNLARGVRRERAVDDSELDMLAVPEPSFEAGLMREAIRPAFRQAFGDAWHALGNRDRNLLRYYYVEGLTKIEIGRIYRLHRTTVTRCLHRAREQLRSVTYASLSDTLSASDRTLQSWLQQEEPLSASVTWQALDDEAAE